MFDWLTADRPTQAASRVVSGTRGALRSRHTVARKSLVGLLGLLAAWTTSSAWASDNRVSYPQQLTMSPKGVNIQTGRFDFRHTDIAIGPLTLVRTVGDAPLFGGVTRSFGFAYAAGTSTPASGWTHNYASGIVTQYSDNQQYRRVVVDGVQYNFRVLSDGSLVPGDATAQGMNLVQTGSQYVMTDHTGAQFTFVTSAAPGSPVVLQQAVYADGSTVSLSYNSNAQPRVVSSNRGYAMVFDYDGNGNVAAVCGFNSSQTYVDAATTCTGATLKVGYGYDSAGSHLTAVTDVTGAVTTISYSDVATGNAYGFNHVACITLPNSSTCEVQNAFGDQPGDPVIGGTNTPCCTKPDQVRVQTTATGNVWRYHYEPPENPNDVPQRPCWPYWSSAEMTDASAVSTSLEYDRGYLVNVSGPEGETGYRYPNGCAAGTEGTTPISVEIRLTRPTLVRKPGGIREYYEYDLRGNVTRFVTFPLGVPDPMLASGGAWVPSDPDLQRCCISLGTPAIPAGSRVIQASYLASYGASNVSGQPYAFGCGSGPSDAKLCDKPTSVTDPNGNVTDYTYDPAHGGVLTETGPAVDGVRPQTRYTYAQRYAWLAGSGGGYVQAATPVWVLVQKSICRTGGASGAGCAAGTGDEIRTLYDYGPNAGPNNLLLRGTVDDATGASLRSCYAYDQWGSKIASISPRAGLTSCP